MLRIRVYGAPHGSCDSGFNFGNTGMEFRDLAEIAESREGKKLKWRQVGDMVCARLGKGRAEYQVYATTFEDDIVLSRSFLEFLRKEKE